MEPVLIVSPHLDDEVLGCSSFLLEHKNVIVVYVSQNHPLFPDGKNIKENLALVNELKLDAVYIYRDKTNIVETVNQSELIGQFEAIFNEKKPHTVLLPFPSYNQDHRAIYEACLTAMRPHDKNHFVGKILLYEQPETIQSLRKVEPFRPTYFRVIDIRDKVELVSRYDSQLREHRSLDLITSLARIRGGLCNQLYAEAFEVIRWIN